MPKRVYQIHATVTGGGTGIEAGTELSPEHVGLLVNMDVVLRHVQSGKIHITHKVTGFYAGTQIAPEDSVVYHLFNHGTISGKPQTAFGFPASDFT